MSETLNLIKGNPEYTVEQIAKLIGKSSRAVENHIARLKKAGILVRKGGTFGGYWEVNIKE